VDQHQFECFECSRTEYEAGEIGTTGSGISRFLNVQNQRFAAVSCGGCGYKELHRMGGRGVGNIFDILTT